MNAEDNAEFATVELFVRNISDQSTEESVLKLFRKQGGKIVNCDFLEGFGIASITYAHSVDSAKAQAACNGADLDGNIL